MLGAVPNNSIATRRDLHRSRPRRTALAKAPRLGQLIVGRRPWEGSRLSPGRDRGILASDGLVARAHGIELKTSKFAALPRFQLGGSGLDATDRHAGLSTCRPTCTTDNFSQGRPLHHGGIARSSEPLLDHRLISSFIWSLTPQCGAVTEVQSTSAMCSDVMLPDQ